MNQDSQDPKKANQDKTNEVLTASGEEWNFSLKSARLTAVELLNSNGHLLTFLPAWTPVYQNSRIRLQASLGVMPMRGTNGSNYFAFDYEIMVSTKALHSYWIELTGGMQLLTDTMTNSPTVGANCHYQLPTKLYFIDSIYLGYSALLLSSGTAHECRIGVSLAF